ncbi:hypothetical protein [Mycolicibacterium canariasense]|nr:hypothetical protein [Mycolicibacterium canariasense]MCV7208380.1 hypothetical protein [Mycolicibacterium canariasense]
MSTITAYDASWNVLSVNGWRPTIAPLEFLRYPIRAQAADPRGGAR